MRWWAGASTSPVTAAAEAVLKLRLEELRARAEQDDEPGGDG